MTEVHSIPGRSVARHRQRWHFIHGRLPLLFTLLIGAGQVLAQTDSLATTITGRVDSMATGTGAVVPAVAAVDSSLNVSSGVGADPDPLRPWRNWPPIDRAIELDALDGPVDIVEKTEIIADRLDDLQLEATRLDSVDGVWEARVVGLSSQLEVLEDLADLQLGGDLQLQQRIESVRDDAIEAQRWRERIELAMTDLQDLMGRWQQRAADYDRQAQLLRRQEEESR